MQKHIQNNKDKRTQFFRKIYLSLYLKGFERITKAFTVWELSWRLNRTAAYWPPLFWLSQPFFPVLLGCSTGGLRAQPFWDMVLIPASSLQLQLLNRGSWGPRLLGAGSLYSILSLTNSNILCTELYYCFTPTQFNLWTVKVIPLIPSTGYTCYLRRCISYFDSSAGVNMQLGRGQYAILRLQLLLFLRIL